MEKDKTERGGSIDRKTERRAYTNKGREGFRRWRGKEKGVRALKL